MRLGHFIVESSVVIYKAHLFEGLLWESKCTHFHFFQFCKKKFQRLETQYQFIFLSPANSDIFTTFYLSSLSK